MGNINQDNKGHFHEVPRAKIAATTAALLIAMPAAAMSISMHQRSTAKADSVSVKSTTSSGNSAKPVTTTVVSESPAEAGASVQGSHTTMTVNGQSVSVPENGTTTQTIETDGGTVNVQATGSGQATNNNGVTTNINVQSNSSGSSNSWSSTNVWVNH